VGLEETPNGHHTVNALVGGVPVQEYIEKLRKIPFDASPVVNLTFTCTELEERGMDNQEGRYPSPGLQSRIDTRPGTANLAQRDVVPARKTKVDTDGKCH
jgi:hypothetical protein